METLTRTENDSSLVFKISKLLSVLNDNVTTADELGETQIQSMQALKDSGLLGCLVPRKYGGMEKDVSFASNLIEQIASVDPSIAIIAFQHMSVISRIMEWGSTKQQNKYLPLLASGQWIAASAWSEKGAGANKQKLSTIATKLDKDKWSISGSKTFTTGAGLADLYLVLVQTSLIEAEGEYGNSGQSFFLLETQEAGIKANSKLNLSGMRGSSTGFIDLEDCVVSNSCVLGPLGAAPKIISNIRRSGLSLGAVSVGICQAAYDLALNHIRTRKLEDKSSIQLKLSQLNMHIEAARSLVEISAAGTRENQSAVSYQSKIFASEISEMVCRECQQIVGGSGFMRGNKVERFYRDARAVALMGPVNDLAKEIIGKELIQ
jgi:alkylation response protein AidB-like acyl-CoA dehydrogenase